MLNLIKEILIFLRHKLLRNYKFSKLYSDEFNTNGVELLKEKINTDSAAKIRDFIDSTIHNTDANIWRDKLLSDERIYGAEEIFPEIKTLLPINEMKEIGQSYLGRDLPYFFILAARLQFKEGNEGSGGGWHRDSPFTPQFKFIVYLSNVSERNGPFEYILKTHTSISKLKAKFNLKKMRFTDDEISKQGKNIKTMVGDEGSILIADTKGLHRGKPIETGKRYACTVYFFENKSSYNNFSKMLQIPHV